MNDEKPDTKPGFEFLRHVSSLSTGAIVLQVGFVEKVFHHPIGMKLLGASIVAFALSIVASVVSQYSLLGIINTGATENWKTFGGFAVVAMWVTFILGLVMAVIFSLRNLLQF